jgi:hypothetical protein
MNLPRPVGSARNWQLGSGELRESSGSDGRWGLAHSQSDSRASECCFEILIPLLTVGHQKDPGMPKILRNSASFRRPPDVT